MRNVIIPNFLKNTAEFSNNDFVKHLISHYDKYKNENYYKLDINLSKIESVNEQITKNKIEDGLNDLTKIQCPILNIDGTPIGSWADLIFIYNVLATKNTFGPNKMTAIFEKFIKNNPEHKITQLHKAYHNLD
jgi:uncharacterized protein YfkK (UPF0435 family)